MQARKTILYFLYANPCYYPPLEHSARLLAGHGFRVEILGTSGEAPGGFEFTTKHPNICIRLLAFKPPGIRQKIHYARFAVWVFYWTLRLRPTCVYASDLLACPIALGITLLPKINVYYHEHDSPDPNPATLVNRALHWCRRRLARRAAASILPSYGRAREFAKETGSQKRPLCVLNCPSTNEVRPRPGECDDESLSVYFHGSIVPARMPVALIRALAELPERVRLSVVGYETAGSIGYIRHLQHLAVELRVGGRLKFLGAFPTRANLLETCSRQDVGIAFMPMKEGSCNERTMAGASNKAFDYLACGVPVLTSDLPDWRSAFVEPGYGLACDSSDPHSIARSLKWFLDHPAERRQMGEKGRQRILADWNYERQFEPVLRMLEGGSE